MMKLKNVFFSAMFMFGAVACATEPGEDERASETAENSVDSTSEDKSASETAEGAGDSTGENREKVASSGQPVGSGCSHMSMRTIGAGCCSFLWSKQKKQKQICIDGSWHDKGKAWCSSDRCGTCSAGEKCR